MLPAAVSVHRRRGRAAHRGRSMAPISTMTLSESGFAGRTAREFALLGIAAAGAFLFFVHGALYLQPGSAARPLTLEGFLLVTTILYLFFRLVFVVAGLYLPRARPEYVVCPECGRQLDDTSPEGIARHHRTALVPKPTEKEVLAAVMLRRAIDDARRSSRHDLRGPGAQGGDLPGDVENLPVPIEEFERILRDLDGGRPPRDPSERRPKGPLNG